MVSSNSGPTTLRASVVPQAIIKCHSGSQKSATAAINMGVGVTLS